MERRPCPRPRWRFTSNILLPVGVAALLIVAIGTFVLFNAARESNSFSLERQRLMVEGAINSSVTRLAQQQQTVAVWDAAVVQLNRTTPDWQWVDTWIGTWLHRIFGHDQVYILDSRNEPVYAMVDGVRAPANSYYAVQPSLRHLTDDLRIPPGVPHDPRDRGSAERPIGSTGPLADGASGDAHLLEVFGRPVAASAMRIVPLTNAVTRDPGGEFLVISVRYLDGSFLRDLSERYLVEAPRWSRDGTVRLGETSVQLTTDLGKPAGYLIWRPELPGSGIIRALGPIAVLALGAILLLIILLIWSLRRSALQLQASEAQAHHLAFHDVLTGLPNRALFNDRLGQALARARRGEKLAVLAVDLDRFKLVNDTLGHHAGDDLIRQFARRVSGLLRSGDTLARLGGDEFAIVQVGIEGRPDVEVLCGRILEAVRHPFDLDGNEVHVGASIGVALAPEAGQDRADLMRKADVALYHAKAEGRDCRCYFTPTMDERVKLRSRIEEDLRGALAAGTGLEVLYQPEVSAESRAVVGLEALVRWQHPTQGTILPDQFIPVAEETGLIGPLGEWVLRQACAISRRWPNLFVAVNLSPVQLRMSGFAEQVIRIVRECGADPHRIELEITEGILLEDADLAYDVLQSLRAAGFRIALDDFGTGYSGISYLRRFAVDKIKIDRSFVQPLGQAPDADAAVMFTAMASLGRAMGLTVAAEGVETEEQGQFVAAAGASELQGYLFSRPLSETRIAALLSAAPASKSQPRSGREPGTEAA